jgi:enoyl-CoA hydratase/carnithine racemase
VSAGFLDEVVALDAVADRARAVATQLAETVHPGPFAMTRHTVRGELAAQLRAGLDADTARFDVHTQGI